jgi:hypothetical protein
MDLSGVELPVTVADALTVALDFMALYRDWVLLGIGIMLGIIITWMLFKIAGDNKKAATPVKGTSSGGKSGSARSSGVRGSKYDAEGYHKRGRGRGAFTSEEKQRAQREMYDYLTKTGRTKERDTWVRNNGIRIVR